jgi:hypothetical protein
MVTEVLDAGVRLIVALFRAIAKPSYVARLRGIGLNMFMHVDNYRHISSCFFHQFADATCRPAESLAG